MKKSEERRTPSCAVRSTTADIAFYSMSREAGSGKEGRQAMAAARVGEATPGT